MKLFQYAVIFVPKKSDSKDAEKPRVLVPVTEVLAVDERSVTLMAARAIPEDYTNRLDEIEVAVRPF